MRANEILVADECMNSRHISIRPGPVCKLDLKKANDRVEQGFLLCRLKRMTPSCRELDEGLHRISQISHFLIFNSPIGSFCGC